MSETINEEESAADRAERIHGDQVAIPNTEDDLIVLMFRCYCRLKSLGWNDAMYARSDGRQLQVIEMGSTGIHSATRDDEGFWIADEFDVWPSHPILFREVGGPREGG